jgi:hypothetical protein
MARLLRIRDAEAACGSERGIFTERMPGHEARIAGEIQTRLALEHPERREAHRHEGRLRVRSEVQGVCGAFPHRGGELFRQGAVDLVEHGACDRKGLGQRLSHADNLAALTGKNESTHQAVPTHLAGMICRGTRIGIEPESSARPARAIGTAAFATGAGRPLPRHLCRMGTPGTRRPCSPFYRQGRRSRHTDPSRLTKELR